MAKKNTQAKTEKNMKKHPSHGPFLPPTVIDPSKRPSTRTSLAQNTAKTLPRSSFAPSIFARAGYEVRGAITAQQQQQPTAAAATEAQPRGNVHPRERKRESVWRGGWWFR